MALNRHIACAFAAHQAGYPPSLDSWFVIGRILNKKRQTFPVRRRLNGRVPPFLLASVTDSNPGGHVSRPCSAVVSSGKPLILQAVRVRKQLNLTFSQIVNCSLTFTVNPRVVPLGVWAHLSTWDAKGLELPCGHLLYKAIAIWPGSGTVSYTHLTLPTILLV